MGEENRNRRMITLDQINLAELGERLRVARSNAGLTQEEAARAVDAARTTLIAIEQGQRKIRIDELRKLAALYNVSINELLRKTATVVDLAAKFRAVNQPSCAREHFDEAITTLNKLAASSVELETRLGYRSAHYYLPERKILPGNLIDQAEELALQLRHRLGLGLSPIVDIFSLLESELGIRIFLRPLHSSISGLFAFDPAVGPCMLINSKHPRERQILTAAHETGHFLVLRSSPDFNCGFGSDATATREERFVNLFGIAFLMPSAALRERFQELSSNNRFSPRQLILLAATFNVSIEAMCRRLEALKLLPNGTFDSLKERGLRVENVRQTIGLPEPKSLSTPKVTMLAVEACRQGLFSEGQICEMLALDRVELRNFMDVFGADELDESLPIKV
jgi:Zn-dependent peptidase ImmA (M78 family)